MKETCDRCGTKLTLWFSNYINTQWRYCRNVGNCDYRETRTIQDYYREMITAHLAEGNEEWVSIYNAKLAKLNKKLKGDLWEKKRTESE